MEFTIEDHYYFSKLKSELIKAGANVKELLSFEELDKYDVVVLNYPEKSFNRKQINIVKKYIHNGGRLIATGYYSNEDNIANSLNTLCFDFGMELKKDQIIDPENCDKNDQLLITTSSIENYNKGVKKVIFPCCASIKLSNYGPNPIAYSQINQKSITKKVIAAETSHGKGRFIMIGTCVFWDNYSLSKYSNLRFSLNLLLN